MKRKISFPAAAEQTKRPPMKKTADEKMVSFADGVCDSMEFVGRVSFLVLVLTIMISKK